MIDAKNATEYFKTTTFAAKWGEFSQSQKEAAVEMAKREFARAIGRPLKEDEPPFQLGDRTREEYAAYEQALYTLVRDTQPNGTGSAVPSLDQDDQQAPAVTLGGIKGQWSPRALAWLGQIGTVTRMGS